MNRMFAIEALARDLCQALRSLRGDHRSWIAIDEMQHCLGVDKATIVNAAVAYAAAKGWMAVGGTPAHSVLLAQGAP
ncbi:hypothetical protein SAMN02745126_05748 [Enhydrobacter aerosaccus]|uniref:Uncharacterized protein n=1 Tax=Enhydrobacter aerosaccus TaxID=225324 RepID=A0A1T4T650_9HYPH|nr:hypothetical protein [Enhydrobacter aerosaccus]SKA35926.1 hypothetical protein SAMN02745126_05748 [Enhydrobacter aerosaccus]